MYYEDYNIQYKMHDKKACKQGGEMYKNTNVRFLHCT